MGRNKEYRQRLRYQVASARKKTLENQLFNEFVETLGLCEAEAELLSNRLSVWLLTQPDIRSPNQIFIRGAEHRNAFARGRASKTGKYVKITPFDASDLDVELEYGLKEMQLGRLLRIVEEVYAQDSLIDLKQLSLLCNITPTSVRARLAEVRAAGVWVPLRGLSTQNREQRGLLRSTYLLQSFFSKEDMVKQRQWLAMSRASFRSVLARFASLVHDLVGGKGHFTEPEEREWAELAAGLSEKHVQSLLRSFSPAGKNAGWLSLHRELEVDFKLSPVKIRAIRELVDEVSHPMRGQDRGNGDVVYWAVAASEPAGKPLDACKLVSTRLSLFADGDWPDDDNKDLNRLSEIKYARIIRYATEAKQAGGYLSYADMSFLMGIHPEAIRGLVDRHPKVIIPMRGAECDIGRGVTHRRNIIELYLQMHTETEILTRTGHSYASIENYIKEFARVWLLWQRGLPPPMIRRVTGRSMQLVNTYLQLAKEYDTPEYAFRFQHLRTLVERDEAQLKKGGPRS